MPIQGTAADIMKLAMIRVEHRLSNEGLAARLIMQVHDELIVECPAAEAPVSKPSCRRKCRVSPSCPSPLPADAHSGPDWLSAKG